MKESGEDLIINVPPGTTKSLTASVMFPAWVWARMAEAQFITASHKYDLAMDLSRKSRDVITSEKYQETFSDIILRSDQKVKTHYMNTYGGFRVASGAGGVVGFHGHFIIVDDPIDPTEVSDSGINAANIWMDETLSQRKVDKRITPMILIMQRLHQDDPTAHMIASSPKDGIKHICLPAEVSEDVKPPELKEYYVNGLLDPVRQSRKVLIEAMAKGEYFYAGQFMQNPKPRGGGMFKTERIAIDSAPNTWSQRVRYLDKAGTKEGGKYTVGLLMGKNCDGFEAQVVTMVRKHCPGLGEGAVVCRHSKGGKYLSVTVTITATSREQLDNIYYELTACEQVLMAL